MLRAPCFIAFAIIITISQVFQIALMHIPPYPFNTFGNKIQNLNVKDGTNFLYNFGNWENIKETDKNKNGIEREDKNLAKKCCYKGDTRKSFVYYPNMFDEDQNFLEIESAIQKILTSSITKTISKSAFLQNPTFPITINTNVNKENSNRHKTPIILRSQSQKIKRWIENNEINTIILIVILITKLFILYVIYTFFNVADSLHNMTREFYLFIVSIKLTENKCKDPNNLTEYELEEREHHSRKLSKDSLIALHYKKLLKFKSSGYITNRNILNTTIFILCSILSYYILCMVK